MTLSLDRIRELRECLRTDTDPPDQDQALKDVDAALDAAETLALLEVWIRAKEDRDIEMAVQDDKQVYAALTEPGYGRGGVVTTGSGLDPDLLTALRKALNEVGA